MTKNDLKKITVSENAIYNGIMIPEGWNHEIDRFSNEPNIPPYLKMQEEGGYAPSVVNIDRGRQLFVDDFLIESTTLTKAYHKPTVHPEPIFRSERLWESGTTATPVSGGVWYDQDEKIFKMWYSAGFCNRLAYATSTDGIHWERPALTPEGSNLILRDITQICSSTVWIDYKCDPKEKYKLMFRLRDAVSEPDKSASVYTSPDGVNWNYVCRTGTLDDRSTFFYNELTDKWVFSLRYNSKHNPRQKWTRYRAYHAGKSFLEAARWKWSDTQPWDGSPESTFFWQQPDSLDPHEPMWGEAPQIYNFDAVDYESITVGMFQIWHGPEVKFLAETKKPKITELQAAFSRDGVNFDRPVRGLGKDCFIPASREEDTWNYGYVQSISGSLIVFDDTLRFYFAAFSGKHFKPNGEMVPDAHFGGSLGMASLRRDGFASMDGTGELTTKLLTVTKDAKYLFVNADAAEGALRAEILSPDGTPLEGFTATDCTPITTNTCASALSWRGGDLSFLQGKGFRIRFVQENSRLYAFWLSPDEAGTSNGATAAGYVKP